MFWVISVYFNIRNTLPKSGTFLLGHPVYTLYIVCIYIYIYAENVCLVSCVKCLLNAFNNLKVDNIKRDVIATNTH